MFVTELYSILFLIKLVDEYFKYVLETLNKNKLIFQVQFSHTKIQDTFNIWNFIAFRTKPRLQFKL